MTNVVELPPHRLSTESQESTPTGTARVFQLSLNDVTIELSSLGASITKILLPDFSRDGLHRDDVVLSYASARDQYEDKNSPFFGAIVGRVANRIRCGRFQLFQTVQSQSSSSEIANATLETYQLEKNNGPNHLHGGFNGFSNKLWDSKIVNDSVQFDLISPHGDQGYPGGIHVSATYSLLPIEGATTGAKLHLTMRANLLPGETKATPIALAQHSYFNLASHCSRERILNHILHMPHCSKFTPVDNTSIPTREVTRVENSPSVKTAGHSKAMDFRSKKAMSDALIQYGEEMVALESGSAKHNVERILSVRKFSEGKANVAEVPERGGAIGANLDGGHPYGFDHNYVIVPGNDICSNESTLRLAAILSHPPTRRALRVSTTAPGLQLYTANHLNGTYPPPSMCKDGSAYNQWQGICLETQTYPNSIYPGNREVCDEETEFAQGQCFILRPGGDDYVHVVEYDFYCMEGADIL